MDTLKVNVIAEMEQSLPERFEEALAAMDVCTQHLEGASFVVAETNLRDALSHLQALLSPEAQLRKRVDHWASIREHLRRAVTESHQLVLEDRLLRARALHDTHRENIPREKRMAIRSTIADLRAKLVQGRVAKSGDKWQENVQMLKSACEGASTLVGQLEAYAHPAGGSA